MPNTLKESTQRKKVVIKLSRIEKCLIVLAQHVDRCPFNEYRVEEQILEELGYYKEPNISK